MNKPILCIMGPTASGKTALALALSESYPIEVISVDSAMIYRGMDIGTAKPNQQELEKCPHHLIDICDPSETYSAAQFVEDAKQCIEAIRERDHIPVFVGGTMLYFQALQQGLDDLPATDPKVRAELQAELDSLGLDVLHQRLQTLDPIAAEKIHPHDPQRTLRALEVLQSSGKPISSFWQKTKNTSTQYKNFALIPERALLHQRIERRFAEMLEHGLLEEAKTLAEHHLASDLPALKTVGYRQVLQYFNGEFDRKTMAEKAATATRRLAKRQITWLRQFDIELLSGDVAMDVARLRSIL